MSIATMTTAPAHAGPPQPPEPVARALAAAASLGDSASLREQVLLFAWTLDPGRSRADPDVRRVAHRFGLRWAEARAHVVDLLADKLWPPRAALPPDPPVYGPPTPPWIAENSPGPDELLALIADARREKLADYARQAGGGTGPGVSRLMAKAMGCGVVSGWRRDKSVGGEG